MIYIAAKEGSPDYYRSRQGLRYIQPSHLSYLSLPVLTFLVGQPWDEFALAVVHGMKPTCIRVTDGEETTDAITGRITVNVDVHNKIIEISRECEVGLPEGVKNGHELWLKLKERGVEI